MKRRLPILVASYSFIAVLCTADTSVSPAFVFDARYATSGVTPALWAANEAVGLSETFVADTRVVYIGGLPIVSNTFADAQFKEPGTEKPQVRAFRRWACAFLADREGARLQAVRLGIAAGRLG